MPSSFSPRFFFILLGISLLPHLVYVWFNTTSITAGLLIACGVVTMLNLTDLLRYRLTAKCATAIGVLLFLLLASSLYNLYKFENTKPIYSFPAVILLFASAISTSSFLSRTSVAAIRGSILAFCFILLGIGWMKVFYVPTFLNYDMHIKPVFPYSEESHFALSLGMMACVYAFIGNMRWAVFVIANMISLGIIYPNLTIVLFFFLSVGVLMMRQRPTVLIMLALVGTPALVWFFLDVVISIDYFASRLNFDDVDNLTTIVFLQGWQLAYLNIVGTYGIGLGFQGLGSESTIIGDLTWQVMRIASGGRALNLADGGFLAAKIIAEFGILGVVGLAYYVIFLIRNSLRFAFWSRSPSTDLVAAVHFGRFAFLFAFLVEVFFRGLGYFSPGLFFALVAGFGLAGAEVGRATSTSKATVQRKRAVSRGPSSAMPRRVSGRPRMT